MLDSRLILIAVTVCHIGNLGLRAPTERFLEIIGQITPDIAITPLPKMVSVTPDAAFPERQNDFRGDSLKLPPSVLEPQQTVEQVTYLSPLPPMKSEPARTPSAIAENTNYQCPWQISAACPHTCKLRRTVIQHEGVCGSSRQDPSEACTRPRRSSCRHRSTVRRRSSNVARSASDVYQRTARPEPIARRASSGSTAPPASRTGFSQPADPFRARHHHHRDRQRSAVRDSDGIDAQPALIRQHEVGPQPVPTQENRRRKKVWRGSSFRNLFTIGVPIRQRLRDVPQTAVRGVGHVEPRLRLDLADVSQV